MKREELAQLIRQSFADVPTPATEDIAKRQCCPECDGLVESFTNVTWQSAPAALIDKNFDKLSLFQVAAFRYFLPAFLLRSVEAPSSDTREFTFYTLTAKPSDLLSDRIRLLSDCQIECIIGYLEYEQKQFDETQQWLETDKVMAKRLAFWRAQLCSK